jgi:hypothetical protein
MEQPLVRGLTIGSLPVAAVALPGALLAAASLGMLMMAVADVHPMWKTASLNMSEAAALRDAATVFRLARAGESSSERRHVRAGLLFDRSVRLTPLEAAIAAGRSEIVGLLLEVGDGVSRAEWSRARCLAASVRDAETERVLDAYDPAHTPEAGQNVDCTTVVRPW